ncbi:MAG: hypothetical protein SOX24_02445 [Candidatus Enterosoma sp.]|nr:hypothetical protein [Candidatus Enterosoma sp.]
MKKIRSIVVLALSALTLASCGGNAQSASASSVGENQNTPSTIAEPASSTQEEVTLSYQFLGNYYQIASQYAAFDFLGNLNSDGTGILYKLTSHADKTQDTLDESKVTWRVEEDRDGIKTMTFKEKTSGTQEAYETDGKFTLALKFTFAGSYSRTIDFVGSSTIQYQTVDEWRTAVEGKAYEGKEDGGDDSKDDDTKTASYTFSAAEVIVDATSTAINNCAAECVLYEDGTATARDGYAMNGTIYSDYVKEEGTWKANDDGSIAIKLKDTDYTASKNGDDLLAFTWHTTNNEGAVHADFVQVK